MKKINILSNTTRTLSTFILLAAVILGFPDLALAASEATVTQKVVGDTVVLRTSLESSEKIDRVDFLRNGVRFASDKTTDGSGNYEASLKAKSGKHQAITVVAYGAANNELARRDVIVDFELGKNSPQEPASFFDNVKAALASTPVPIARSFPYLLFGALALLALWLSRQAAREIVFVQRLTKLLKKEKLLAEEKESFLALSSHYLNTPLTLMRNGLELLNSLNRVSLGATKPLQELIDQLARDVKQLNFDTQHNTALTGITEPDLAKAHKKLRVGTSPFVMFPLIFVAGLVIFANFLFGVVGQLPLDVVNLITQVVLIGVVAVMLYAAERSRRLHKQERQVAHMLLDHQRSIDVTRNAFIQHSRGVLAGGLFKIGKQADVLGSSKETEYFWRGYKEFGEVLAKFALLGSLEKAKTAGVAEIFSPVELADRAWQVRAEQISSKKLKLKLQGEEASIRQNRPLLTYVIDSIMDNAIKFSRSEGTVSVDVASKKKSIRVAIENQGDAVLNDQMSHLFQPFSRTESVLTYNYKGLGFSLFLCKVIIGYLGGTIRAYSVPGKKMTIKMEIPSI